MTPTQHQKYLIAISTGLTQEQAKFYASSKPQDISHLIIKTELKK